VTTKVSRKTFLFSWL